MLHLVTGILAHVDAGKTTLSESMMYLSGRIRTQGRVDHGDSHLDTDSMEQRRGITIFSGQAEIVYDKMSLTLLDTPGHVDFSPEMERTLTVLDEAVLVISAPDGVTGQVKTLWELLGYYRIPTFIFVNKMDQPGMDAEKIMADLKKQLGEGCVRFDSGEKGSLSEGQETMEEIAVCDDRLLERFLADEPVGKDDIRGLVRERKLFPVYFGSALHNDGTENLLRGISLFSEERTWPEEFSARVFRITHDSRGNRLTWMKITGGALHVKDVLPHDEETSGEWKADQIRVYTGKDFESVQSAEAGTVCAVTGLTDTRIGEIIGAVGQDVDTVPRLQPVFTRSVFAEDDTDSTELIRCLRMLEEEEPLLHIRVDKESGEITADIMGEVETEILRELCSSRFGISIGFGPASIVYRETIAAPSEGVGHYEPLRHYAEVHLLLEPAARGSGVTFASAVSTDQLSVNWQRLVISILEQEDLKGVLTGSGVTDMRITLIGGRASEVHTSGGDFRQATIRAFRQGLMMAENVLLEPYYDFTAEVPSESSGRLLTDVVRMDGEARITESSGEMVRISGRAAAAAFGDYQAEVRAYTHGKGHISLTPGGYEPCRNAEEVVLQSHYDPEADLSQSPDSVFCSHGAGMLVPWDHVREYMHVDTGFRFPDEIRNDNSGTPAADHEDADARPENKTEGEGETLRAGELRKNRNARKDDWHAREKEREENEKELRRIFENTYRGSAWETPIHSELNWSNEPGIWSRDGSLEKEAARKEEERRKGDQGRDGGGKTNVSSDKKSGKKSGKEDYLLVDGYNIIFAWQDLRNLAAQSIDAARDALIDILSDYQGTRGGNLILVFDAYKVHGGRGEVYHYHNIDVVYTREAETADTYIVETAHKLSNKGSVTVATSDGIIQVIIMGDNARRMSARDLEEDVARRRQDLRDRYNL